MDRPFQTNERVKVVNSDQPDLNGRAGLVTRVLIRDSREAWIQLDPAPGETSSSAPKVCLHATEVEPETAPAIPPKKTGAVVTTGSKAQPRPQAPDPELLAICSKYGIPGRDHYSTLLFLQTVEANNSGNLSLSDERMRSKQRTHSRFGGEMKWTGEYGSRYFDGTYEPAHDDFDCLNDLELLGLLTNSGTGFNPRVALTDQGMAACGELIRWRGQAADRTRNKAGSPTA